MRIKETNFDFKNVISYDNATEFVKISDIVDIIPAIVETNRGEMEILEKWKKHFRELEVPFAITRTIHKTKARDISYLSLWKERRING